MEYPLIRRSDSIAIQSLRDHLAEEVSHYIKGLKEILKVKIKHLSVKFGNGPSYLQNLKWDIIKGKLSALKYYKKLNSWYEVLEQELEMNKIEECEKRRFFDLHATHLKSTTEYVKKKLFIKYNHYRNIIVRSGWLLETTFDEFLSEVLDNDIRPNYYDLKISKGHEVKTGLAFIKLSSQSTKYATIISVADELRLDVETPSSEEEWIDMIFTSDKPPSFIPIKVKCRVGHDSFPTNSNNLQQKHGCIGCFYESLKLSISEIKSRGLQFGFELVTPPNQALERIKLCKSLQWQCIKHKEEITCSPYFSKLSKAYCRKCSKGKITDERIIRYILNSMFRNHQFGEEVKYLQEIGDLMYKKIINNKRIRDYLTKNSISYDNYKRSSIDCFGIVKIKGKEFKISVEVWGPHHKSLRLHSKLYPRKTSADYKRLKVYDNLKKLLWEEGFLDIHIVISLDDLKKYERQAFIIKELKRQLLKGHGIDLKTNFPLYTWNKLLKDVKQAEDYQSLDGY